MEYLNKILIDGGLLSVSASIYLMFVMKINPRFFLHDYPKAIQEKVPPKTGREKRLGILVGLPFLLLLLGVPIWSALTLKQAAPQPVPFLLLFADAFGVGFLFNLVDWLILDWLIFCAWTPGFLVIPGSEGMAAYKDFGFHFRGFLTGTLITIIYGLIVAGVLAIL